MSTHASLCFPLDQQTSASFFSQSNTQCSQHFKENECTLKMTCFSVQKNNSGKVSGLLCYFLYASSWYKLHGNVLSNDKQKQRVTLCSFFYSTKFSPIFHCTTAFVLFFFLVKWILVILVTLIFMVLISTSLNHFGPSKPL